MDKRKNRPKIWDNDPNLQYELLKILRDYGPISREDICEKLNYPTYGYLPHNIKHDRKYKFHRKRTNVYENLKILLKNNLIEKYRPSPTGKKGRPKVLWKIIR